MPRPQVSTRPSSLQVFQNCLEKRRKHSLTLKIHWIANSAQTWIFYGSIREKEGGKATGGVISGSVS